MSIALVGQSQETPFKFDVLSHDFGMLTEGDTAIYAFAFTNTTKDTIRLTAADIKPGCGCTTGKYTETPIAPGGRGEITAIYKTIGRQGVINKSIGVLQNNQNVAVLYIKGYVAKQPDSTITEKQIKAAPRLTLDRSAYNFGKVEKGQKVLTTFIVKNTGKDTLRFSSVQMACNCVTHKLFKEKSTEATEYILPGKSASMELTYFPSGVGKARDIYILTTNSKATPYVSITLEADVVESLQQKSVIMDGSGDQAPFGK